MLSPENEVTEIWHIYTMEYDSAMKRNEVPIHAIAWMDFENNMSKEGSPS